MVAPSASWRTTKNFRCAYIWDIGKRMEYILPGRILLFTVVVRHNMKTPAVQVRESSLLSFLKGKLAFQLQLSALSTQRKSAAPLSFPFSRVSPSTALLSSHTSICLSDHFSPFPEPMSLFSLLQVSFLHLTYYRSRLLLYAFQNIQ